MGLIVKLAQTMAS